MINWIRKKFGKKECTCTCLTEDERAIRNGTIIAKQLTSVLLADLSIETLKSVVKKAEENQQAVGHMDYSSLAELYCSTMRGRWHKIMRQRWTSENPEKPEGRAE